MLRFTVRNTDRVISALVKKQGAITDAGKRAIEDSGQRVYLDALSLTPVDTGFMVDTLRLTYLPSMLGYEIGWYAQDYGGLRPTGFPRPFYPPFVVLGTSKMAGRDPLTPALEGDRGILTSELGEACRAS